MTNDEFNLTPEFESSTLEYNVTVPYETEDVFIEGTLVEPDCNITGLGTHALNTGENTVNITINTISKIFTFFFIIQYLFLSSYGLLCYIPAPEYSL